jgi:ABC-type nickel/cobalt efflux system permease component RcnA
MSVGSQSIETRGAGLPTSLLARLAVGAAATAIVGLGLAALGYLVFVTGLVAPPSPRNPFATGAGGFASATSGLGGIILIIQAHFYAALIAAVQALKADGVGLTSLATVGFLYGIFHAAGPGHGKGVISGYIIASKGSISHGLALSLAAALLQAVVAIAVVGVFAAALNATAATINAAARNIELASFAAVAGLGAVLVLTKAGEFVRLAAAIRSGVVPSDDGATVQLAPRQGRRGNWPIFAGVVLAAGIRPCSGAIILLVFSLSQGLFAAGVVGALAMALGTSITTGTLASLTVFAKAMVQRLSVGRGMAGPVAFAGFELLAAAFVLMLGAMLFAGVWAGGMISALD